MIKIIILFVIIVFLIYAIPKLNKPLMNKKNKKKQNNEHFTDQLTERDFLENIEGSMCVDNMEDMDYKLHVSSPRDGIMARSTTDKQLECIPVCSSRNGNIEIIKDECTPCGSGDLDMFGIHPGYKKRRATDRCIDIGDDEVEYTILESGDISSHSNLCTYGDDFNDCESCEIEDIPCSFNQEGNCKKTIKLKVPSGSSRCKMNWGTYSSADQIGTVRDFVNTRTAELSSQTEYFDSLFEFNVDCGSCDIDCTLTNEWTPVGDNCPTTCGMGASDKQFKKDITQINTNNGTSCVSLAMELDSSWETNPDVQYAYNDSGNSVIKTIPNDCPATLSCCEEGNNSHYTDWQYSIGDASVWDDPSNEKECDVTYTRTRELDNTKCLNSRGIPYRETQSISPVPCCDHTNMSHIYERYNYQYYNIDDDIETNDAFSNAFDVTPRRLEAPCETKVLETTKYLFDSTKCKEKSTGQTYKADRVSPIKIGPSKCPANCEMQPLTPEFSECLICKDNLGDVNRQYRQWKITQEKVGTGKSCDVVFNESKQLTESATVVPNVIDRIFQTHLDASCDNVKVCCKDYSPYINDHFYQTTPKYEKYSLVYNNIGQIIESNIQDPLSSEDGLIQYNDIDSHCDTKITKTVGWSNTSQCTLKPGFDMTKPFPEHNISIPKISRLRCPIDCELSISEFTSNCFDSRPRYADRPLVCGNGKQYRTWKVTTASQFGGKSCQEVYDSNVHDDSEERINNINNVPGDLFQSRKDCSTSLPCCEEDNDEHYSSNIKAFHHYTPHMNNLTYDIYTDVDPIDNFARENTKGTLLDGSRLFNIYGSVPCNSRMQAIYDFTPNNTECAGGEPFERVGHSKVNENMCAMDCELSVSKDVDGNSWSQCEDRQNIFVTCNPDPENPPVRQRTWIVTKTPSGTGSSCQTVFDNMDPKVTDKEVGETTTISSSIGVNQSVISYQDCNHLDDCCNPNTSAHWTASNSYEKITPYNSDDQAHTQFMSNDVGDDYFNLLLTIPCNTKIRKTTAYTRDTTQCIEGQDKADLIDEKVNTGECPIHCELNRVNTWGECISSVNIDENCSDGRQIHQWQVETMNNTTGSNCQSVFDTMNETGENTEIDEIDFTTMSASDTFNSYKSCSNLPCCDSNNASHWNYEAADDIDKEYFRKYDHGQVVPIIEGSRVATLSGNSTTSTDFENPECGKKVIKYKKLLRNEAVCQNGHRDHYEIDSAKLGRPNCDCEIDLSTPVSTWVDNCSTSSDYITREWDIINNVDTSIDSSAKTCANVFTSYTMAPKESNEEFDSINTVNKTLTSKKPCPVDCVLSVAETDNPSTTCPICNEAGATSYSKYSWRVITQPNHNGNTCEHVYNLMSTNRNNGEFVEDPGNFIQDVRNTTFESKVECDIPTCAPLGTFEFVQESIQVTPFGFSVTLIDNTSNRDYEYDNDLVEVDVTPTYLSQNDREAFARYRDYTSGEIVRDINDFNLFIERDTFKPPLGTTDHIEGNVFIVDAGLQPDTQYNVVYRRMYKRIYDIDPIYTNMITFRTLPVSCELSVSEWTSSDECTNTCYITDNPPTKTRTWTVTQTPDTNALRSGDAINYCNTLLNDTLSGTSEARETSSQILGNTLGSTITTQSNCDLQQCGACTYGDWINNTGSDRSDPGELQSWNGELTNVPCGKKYSRTRNLSTDNCINRNDLSGTETQTKEALPCCDSYTPTHWTEHNTYKLYTGVYHPVSNSSSSSTYADYSSVPTTLPCNTQVIKHSTYSKNDSCFDGELSKEGSDSIFRENREVCPIDCLLSVSQPIITTDCPSCGGTNKTKTQERTWKVTREKAGSGSDCQAVFDTMKVDTNESSSLSSLQNLQLNTGFTSTLTTGCVGLTPCCDRAIPTHFSFTQDIYRDIGESALPTEDDSYYSYDTLISGTDTTSDMDIECGHNKVHYKKYAKTDECTGGNDSDYYQVYETKLGGNCPENPNVSEESVTNNAITITWNPKSNGDTSVYSFVNYKVLYKKVIMGQDGNVYSTPSTYYREIKITNKDTTTQTIGQLEPNTYYEIKVTKDLRKTGDPTITTLTSIKIYPLTNTSPVDCVIVDDYTSTQKSYKTHTYAQVESSGININSDDSLMTNSSSIYDISGGITVDNVDDPSEIDTCGVIKSRKDTYTKKSTSSCIGEDEIYQYTSFKNNACGECITDDYTLDSTKTEYKTGFSSNLQNIEMRNKFDNNYKGNDENWIKTEYNQLSVSGPIVTNSQDDKYLADEDDKMFSVDKYILVKDTYNKKSGSTCTGDAVMIKYRAKIGPTAPIIHIDEVNQNIYTNVTINLSITAHDSFIKGFHKGGSISWYVQLRKGDMVFSFRELTPEENNIIDGFIILNNLTQNTQYRVTIQKKVDFNGHVLTCDSNTIGFRTLPTDPTPATTQICIPNDYTRNTEYKKGFSSNLKYSEMRHNFDDNYKGKGTKEDWIREKYDQLLSSGPITQEENELADNDNKMFSVDEYILVKETYSKKSDSTCTGDAEIFEYRAKIGPTAPIIDIESTDITTAGVLIKLKIITNDRGMSFRHGFDRGGSFSTWHVQLITGVVTVRNFDELDAASESVFLNRHGFINLANLIPDTRYQVTIRKTVTFNGHVLNCDSNTIDFRTKATTTPATTGISLDQTSPITVDQVGTTRVGGDPIPIPSGNLFV